MRCPTCRATQPGDWYLPETDCATEAGSLDHEDEQTDAEEHSDEEEHTFTLDLPPLTIPPFQSHYGWSEPISPLTAFSQESLDDEDADDSRPWTGEGMRVAEIQLCERELQYQTLRYTLEAKMLESQQKKALYASDVPGLEVAELQRRMKVAGLEIDMMRQELSYERMLWEMRHQAADPTAGTKRLWHQMGNVDPDDGVDVLSFEDCGIQVQV